MGSGQIFKHAIKTNCILLRISTMCKHLLLFIRSRSSLRKQFQNEWFLTHICKYLIQHIGFSLGPGQFDKRNENKRFLYQYSQACVKHICFDGVPVHVASTLYKLTVSCSTLSIIHNNHWFFIGIWSVLQKRYKPMGSSTIFLNIHKH